MRIFLSSFLLIFLFLSCNSENSDSPNDPYTKMHVVFTGRPDKEDIEPQLEAVMNLYNIPITDDNLLKIANMLYVLKKESKVGVTELQILKNIYQTGYTGNTLEYQAALSATLLEHTN